MACSQKGQRKELKEGERMQIHIPNGAGEARTHPLELKKHKWTGGCPAMYGSVAVRGREEKEQKVTEVDIFFSHLFHQVWTATVQNTRAAKTTPEVKKS